MCAASVSNLLGIVLTPLLVGCLLHARMAAFSLDALGDIVAAIAAAVRGRAAARGRWIGGWRGTRTSTVLGLVDRGSILLVVYAAFSEGVSAAASGTSSTSPQPRGVLLRSMPRCWRSVLAPPRWRAGVLGFAREDEIAIVFCGSKKSLASGLPMASVLFPAASVGLIVLPLMLFHQIQLMVCAAIARRFARSAPTTADTAVDTDSGRGELTQPSAALSS